MTINMDQISIRSLIRHIFIWNFDNISVFQTVTVGYTKSYHSEKPLKAINNTYTSKHLKHLIPAGLAPLKISKSWFFQIQPLRTWLLFHLQELSDFYMWMAFLYIQKQKHKRITIYYILVLFLSVQLTFSSVLAIFFLFLQKIIFFYVIKGYSFHYHQIMTGLTSFLLQSKIHAQNEFALTYNTCLWFIALIYTTKRRLKIFLSSKTYFLKIIFSFCF